MAVYNLGQAAIVSKGAYNANTSYKVLNTVTNLGGFYMCIAPCAGVEPGVTSGWQSYWVATARGINGMSITANGGVATVVITFSDGSQYTGTYNTDAIGPGAVGTTELASRSVTGAKVALGTIKEENLDTSTLDYETVNLASDQVRKIFVTDTVPTTASPDGIYLVYE